MSTKLPPLKIVASVDTKGVASGLKAAEAKLKHAEARMAKLRGAAAPSLGALGGGQLGGLVGAAGQFGMGGAAAGLGAAGIASPFLIANRVVDSFAEATKGSTAALKELEETGKNTTKLNSFVLSNLSKSEAASSKAAGGPGALQAFSAGAGGSGVVFDWAKSMKEGTTALVAFTGALSSGKSVGESVARAQATIGSEAQGRVFADKADAIARAKAMETIGDALQGRGTTNRLLRMMLREIQ